MAAVGALVVVLEAWQWWQELFVLEVGLLQVILRHFFSGRCSCFQYIRKSNLTVLLRVSECVVYSRGGLHYVIVAGRVPNVCVGIVGVPGVHGV